MGKSMGREKQKSSLEDQIEENLRKVYQQKATEDVPEQLLELIQRLRAQEDAR